MVGVMTVPVAASYLRFRILRVLVEAGRPMPGWELLRALASEYRPAGGSAAVDSECELLIGLGAPVEAVPADSPEGAVRWLWDPRPDDPHWQATGIPPLSWTP